MKPLTNVRFLRDADLPGLEIAEVRDSVHVFPSHCHDHYAIGIMDWGASYCVDDDRRGSCVSRGQVALINPGQVHGGMPAYDGCISYRMFYVESDWMRRMARDISGLDAADPEFSRWVAQDPELYARLDTLSSLVVGNAGRLEKQSAMVRAFSHMLSTWADVPDSGPDQGGEHRAVAMVKEILRADLAEKVSLDELAARTGLSRYYLLRVFKRETGLPPHAYQTQLRIDRAKELLLSGVPIADAALDTGFTDQSHLTNAFRRLVGATPGQYLSL